MAHPATAPAGSTNGVSPNPIYIIHGAHGPSVAQLNIDELKVEWSRLYLACGGPRTYIITRQKDGYEWMDSYQEQENSGLKVPGHCTIPDPPVPVVPEPKHRDDFCWNKCHLLSLPKELRLHIYEYVLDNPSDAETFIGLHKEIPLDSYKLERASAPRISYFPKGHPDVYPQLLRTNSFIYKEALPILYRSAKFMVEDLEGLLPLFLETLSPYARSCIRTIHLSIPTKSYFGYNSRCATSFHWPITFAQIAKLNGTLKTVEICGDWAVFTKPSSRRAFLNPLCKIKAKKVFIPSNGRANGHPYDYQAAFDQLLAEAEESLKANAKTREECTKADAIARKEKEEERRKERDEVGKNPPPRTSTSPTMEEWCRWAEDNLKRMDQDLSSVQGIKQFEKELEKHSNEDDGVGSSLALGQAVDDWDLVSIRSGASTPKARPASVASGFSNEIWPDTASTLVGKEDRANDEAKDKDTERDDESDAGSESWEHVQT